MADEERSGSGQEAESRDWSSWRGLLVPVIREAALACEHVYANILHGAKGDQDTASSCSQAVKQQDYSNLERALYQRVQTQVLKDLRVALCTAHINSSDDALNVINRYAELTELGVCPTAFERIADDDDDDDGGNGNGVE